MKISRFWLNGAHLTLHDAWAARDAELMWVRTTPEELLDELEAISMNTWARLGDARTKRVYQEAWQDAA